MADVRESLREWGEKIKVQSEVKLRQKLYKSKHDPNPELVHDSTFQKGQRKPTSKGMKPERKKKVYRKAPVPKRADAPIRPQQTKKNFVMANAIEAILASSKHPISSLGKGIDRSGKGKVPAYLGRVKEEIRQEKQAIEDAILLKEKQEREAKGITIETSLDEDERLALVEKLKTKWDELNHQYQRHSHIVNLDTVGKINRKQELKEMLEEVERALDRLRGPVTILKTFRTPQVPA